MATPAMAAIGMSLVDTAAGRIVDDAALRFAHRWTEEPRGTRRPRGAEHGARIAVDAPQEHGGLDREDD